MMKCMIVHNEGIFILLVCITAVGCSFVAKTSQAIQELCSSNRYIYRLQPGNSHELKLKSVNSTAGINKWYQKSKRKCRKEFKTNDGASHFMIKVSNISIPSCSEVCHCNYFEIAEPGHVVKFCGKTADDIYFESKTDYLSIQFHHGLSMGFDVTLTFSVQRNTYVISGIPKDDLTSGRFLETPFFPQLFKSDYIAEYILQSDDMGGHVMLMFLDFQLAPDSFIEVLGHNNTHPAIFFGDIFRPPILISETNQLNLKFEANNQVAPGFRAVVFFISGSDVTAFKPFTNCGGAKEGFSGIISVERSGKHNYYDCLWILSNSVFSHDKYHVLSVSNLTLDNIGSRATLEFREGTNSKSTLIKTINCVESNCSLIPDEIVIPASKGLYIRFNGLLNPDSIVHMIYSTYRNGNCSDSDVLCNGRCLLPSLLCDGIKNCPDGSDELECTGTTSEIITPSPPIIKKKSHSSATETSFLVVLLFGICGIIVVILVIVLAVYRHMKVVPPRPEASLPPQVREMLATALPRTCHRSSTYYDQPPSYDDFVRTSEQYPPLLFTRAAKRHSEPYNSLYAAQHTTSFCTVQRKRPASDLSSVFIENDHLDKTPVEQPLFSEPSCSFERSNTEWSFKEMFLKNSSGSLRKTTSLDSVLNKGSDKDCHVQVSITHSIRPCCQQNKFQSLPTRFKINELNRNQIDITFLTTLPDSPCGKKRKFSSCMVCRNSSLKSELMTTVKTRCQSDPCKRVKLCYSLSSC